MFDPYQYLIEPEENTPRANHGSKPAEFVWVWRPGHQLAYNGIPMLRHVETAASKVGKWVWMSFSRTD